MQFKIINMAKGQELPTFKENRNGNWIDYGSDNLYPQYLLDVFHHRSNKHKAIINRKVDMSVGNGIAKPTTAELEKFIKNTWGTKDLEEISIHIDFDFEIMNGFSLIVKWNIDGKDIFLPKRSAAIGAIILRENKKEGIQQPEGVFIYNGNQYRIPLRYIYFKDKLYDFESGLDAGVFLYASLKSSSDGKVSINERGAALYLSKRTVHSQLARLYLFNQKSDYIKLVHTEDSYIVDSLKQQGVNVSDFVYYQGFQGPIKIWEISYPKDIKANPEFLKTDFPNQNLNLAKPGEYS